MKFSHSEQRKALIDAGACANAISEKDYKKLKSSCENISHFVTPMEVRNVKLASGQIIPVRGQIELEFTKANYLLRETFLVPPNTNSIILGNPFFKNNSIELHPKENLMKLLDLTLQLNRITKGVDKPSESRKTVRTTVIITIDPSQQTTIRGGMYKTYKEVCGIVEPNT